MNKLLLVGAGHMGTSLLKGWKKNKIKYISVVDPKVSQKNKKVKNIQYYKSLSQIKDINKFNIIFFAVKPQVINKVIKDYKKVYLKNKLIISIIAGKNIKDSDKSIIHQLKEEGKMFLHETIQHSYPFCWRTDTPLIYKPFSTWFLNVEAIKEKM